MKYRSVLAGLGFAATLAIAANPAAAQPAPVSAAAHMSDAAAAADGHWWNERDLWIAFPTPAGAVACVSRTILLEAGTYSWRQHGYGYDPQIVKNTPSTLRYIDLAQGKYLWKDCLRAGSAGGYRYYHDTYLKRIATGDYAHLKTTSFWSNSAGTFKVKFGSNMWS